MKTDWISIEERVPEFLTNVLCVDTENKVIILKLQTITAIQEKESTKKNLTWMQGYSDEYYYDVTFWMALPETPSLKL